MTSCTRSRNHTSRPTGRCSCETAASDAQESDNETCPDTGRYTKTQEPKSMGRGAGGGAGSHLHPEIKSEPGCPVHCALCGCGAGVVWCTMRAHVSSAARRLTPLGARSGSATWVGGALGVAWCVECGVYHVHICWALGAASRLEVLGEVCAGAVCWNSFAQCPVIRQMQ